MKVTLYIIGYLFLLFPTLLLALDKLVDIADPPVVTPSTDHSFWLSGFGQCVWFGVAFILPALALFILSIAMRQIWRLVERSSHDVA